MSGLPWWGGRALASLIGDGPGCDHGAAAMGAPCRERARQRAGAVFGVAARTWQYWETGVDRPAKHRRARLARFVEAGRPALPRAAEPADGALVVRPWERGSTAAGEAHRRALAELLAAVAEGEAA